jgi:hypothetical protein
VPRAAVRAVRIEDQGAEDHQEPLQGDRSLDSKNSQPTGLIRTYLTRMFYGFVAKFWEEAILASTSWLSINVG